MKLLTSKKNKALPEYEKEKVYFEEETEEIKPKRKGKTVLILLLLSLLFVCAGVATYQVQHRNDIKIKLEYDLLLGRDYKMVKKSLKNLGFTQISYNPVADLTKNDTNKSELVTEVSINGISPFESKTWYAKDSDVQITYHVLDPEHQNDICLHQDAADLVGQNCRIIISKLKDAGFSNIEEHVVEDLTMKEVSQENLVTVIRINGDADYQKETWVSPDSEIEICYHVLDPERKNDIQIPDDAKSYIGQNYEEIAQKLRSMGFTNIQYAALNDLGWFSNTGNGEITEISLNGDAEFEAGTWTSPDAEIIITYHSKSSTQPTNETQQRPSDGQNGTSNHNGNSGSNWFDKWWPFHW